MERRGGRSVAYHYARQDSRSKPMRHGVGSGSWFMRAELVREMLLRAAGGAGSWVGLSLLGGDVIHGSGGLSSRPVRLSEQGSDMQSLLRLANNGDRSSKGGSTTFRRDKCGTSISIRTRCRLSPRDTGRPQAVRFEKGQSREVSLIPWRGPSVYGFGGRVMGGPDA